MNKEYATKWISKRLGSIDYKNFILANLFYDGKIPKRFYEDDFIGIWDIDVDKLDDTDCVYMSYNSIRRPIRKKVNYLLAKPYSVEGKEEVRKYFEESVDFFKETVTEIYKKGEAWWEYEADPESLLRFKLTLRKAESIVPHYTNEEKTEYDSVGYLWNRIDDYGNITRYVDFVDREGRHRFPLTYEGSPQEVDAEDLGHAVSAKGQKVVFKRLPFIRLTWDSMYLLIRFLGKMYSDRYVQTDRLLEDNADPVAVIKNASDTDAEIIYNDIKQTKAVKVEGTGDFSYASKSMDYSSLESFLKMLKSDIADQLGVVSREQELSYVSSGRALDRLYVDMDNDAADMGQILRNSAKDFLDFIKEETGKDYLEGFNITFNTDKPTDEQNVISNINSSSSLLSKRTLLKNHPWVEDVEEELKLIEEEQGSGQQSQFEDPYVDPYSQEPLQEEPVQPEEEPPVEDEEEEEEK